MMNEKGSHEEEPLNNQETPVEAIVDEAKESKKSSIWSFIILGLIAAPLIALFWPRMGEHFPNCKGTADNRVWIGLPTDEEVLEQFKVENPDLELVESPTIIKEKVFEELTPCKFLNFHGRREVHWVRVRCSVYYSGEPGVEKSVYYNFDHYHLNGGGCAWPPVIDDESLTEDRPSTD